MTASLEPTTAPDRDDLEAVGEFVFRFATAFDGFTAQMRRAFDLNAHERLALAALWAHGPLTMTDLGSWIPLSRAAVTTLVDRMEDGGLVRRGSDAADRRRTVVQITPEATSRMTPVIEPWGVELGELVGTFDADEWGIVHRFIDGMRQLNDKHANRLRDMADEEIQGLAVGQP